MRLKRIRLLPVVIGAGTLLLAAGCAVGLDALNPALFSALGIDTSGISGSRGTVIVSFTNKTDSTAIFFAFQVPDVENIQSGARNFSVEVPAGASRNEVLDCPVGLLSPGSLGADFAVDAIAAQVLAATGTQDVSYAYSLIEGQQFQCGDVIDIELTTITVTAAQGGATTAAYAITVRVIPGH